MGISKDPCPQCADKGITVRHGDKIAAITHPKGK